ncbi:hypothetical protein Tco_0566642 [Tanacetum coccineum]
MEDGIFFNQSNYIKEMLKKFGLEDSKLIKKPMSTEIKLTKDDEADSMDSSKYYEKSKMLFRSVKAIFRYIRGTSHLGLWYPKGTRIETVVYADSDHAGDYVDRKSTSGVCTKMPSEYQQDYKKTRAYALKIYNDLNMSDTLRDIYRTLENRYVHEGRTINPSFYNDLSDDSVAKFAAIGFDCLLSLDEQICPRFIFEFYKTLKLERDSNNHFLIQFIMLVLCLYVLVRTPSPPPRKKSLSPPQAPSISISSKSTHYTSSSSPSESLTPTHVAPQPNLRFVIPIKLEPQELPSPQILPNDPYTQTMDN